jgi:hypothetical protein
MQTHASRIQKIKTTARVRLKGRPTGDQHASTPAVRFAITAGQKLAAAVDGKSAVIDLSA